MWLLRRGQLTNVAALFASGYDADAADFFTRASITDGTQKSAVNQLVLDLKAAGLWSLIELFYPFVGAAATPHGINLKANSFPITWAGTVTHNANGITGDAATGWGNTGWATSAATIATQDSVHIYCYCRTQTPTTNGRFIGVSNTAGLSRLGLLYLGPGLGADGLHNGTSALNVYGAMADMLGSICWTRTTSTLCSSYIRALTGVTDATVSVGTCAGTLGILARNFQSFGPDNFSNANLAAVCAGSGLSGANYTALATAVQTFQTALGRNV